MIVEYPTRDTIGAYGIVYIDARQQLTYGLKSLLMLRGGFASFGGRNRHKAIRSGIKNTGFQLVV